MTHVANRPNRKASSEDIIRLNSIGLPLRAIGHELGCHHSTVKSRLETMGIKPADTRRSFMEDIYNNLPPEIQEWLPEQIQEEETVREFVKRLILKQYQALQVHGSEL